MRGRIRLGSFATAVVLASAATSLSSSPAAANGAYCVTSHCYSVLDGFYTTFIGMSGTWNRANMTTYSTQSQDYFVDSEMWFQDANCLPAWVEEGLTVWFDPVIQTGAYEAFWAYQDTGSHYAEFAIAYILPNSATTDNYQIARSGSTNVFNVWWDGSVRATPNVGFWSGACLSMGGEIYSNGGHADTFNMYGRAINTASQSVNWGTQGGYISDTSQLNGFSYQNSEWSWNTVR